MIGLIKPHQWAIEIKSSTSPGVEDVAGLLKIQDDYPGVACVCLCQTEQTYVDGGIEFVPWQEGIQYILRGSREAIN